MRKTTIGTAVMAAGLALGACGSAAASVHATPPPPRPAQQTCTTFTIGFQPPGGTEANEQWTFCGTGVRKPLTCQANEPPQPGATFICDEGPRS